MKNRMHLTALISATVFASATSSAVFAETADPVAITSVNIQPAAIPFDPGTLSSRPQMGSVKVAFINYKPVDATEVDFALYVNGKAVRTAALTGKFSKGVTITHSWSTTVHGSNQAAAITQVKFADGTVWVKS